MTRFGFVVQQEGDRRSPTFSTPDAAEHYAKRTGRGGQIVAVPAARPTAASQPATRPNIKATAGPKPKPAPAPKLREGEVLLGVEELPGGHRAVISERVAKAGVVGHTDSLLHVRIQ